MSRPNFLLFMSDQHNPHILRCAGDPIVRTPHLDRLAAEGIRFGHTYCAEPLCVPSRMTFLTSQHPSDIQVWTNACVLPSDVPTFAHLLSLAGYETVLCGRMHFVGPDQHHGFHRRLVGDVSGAMEAHGHLFEGKIPTSTTGQTAATMEAIGPGRHTYMAYDESVTERACRYLLERDRESPENPFCLVVGYLLPHCPYICPKALFDEYRDQVTLPEVPPGYLEALHPAMRQWRAFRGVEHITPEQARTARAAYYGLVTLLDRNVGQVMAALASTRFAKETLVCYTSDHGDMAGELGMWWKDSFYEGSAGVPMIWWGPQRFRAGAVVDSVTSLLDIAPTLLDLGGADPLPHARGTTLRAFLEPGGNPICWPNVAFAETCARGQRPARMIRSGPWKLNVYHGYEDPQLFHLPSDPQEVHDLGRHPEHQVIREVLFAQVCRGWCGQQVEDRLSRRQVGREVVRRWQARVGTGESERWRIPTGCNVFPEE